MRRVTAPGERDHPALALVNTRDARGEALADAGALRAWIAHNGLAADARVDAVAAARMRELREAVRELLTARVQGRAPTPAALAAVNAAAAAAPTAPMLRWDDADGPREHRDCLGAGGAVLAAAVVAADAMELVAGPRHADLRACGAHGCVRLLLKDHPRRQWCSDRCGDRVRASRYYHRHKAAGAA
jgi:predicted RNA-binding Zn ribbon-like protein